jgi:hypothetical protein
VTVRIKAVEKTKTRRQRKETDIIYFSSRCYNPLELIDIRKRFSPYKLISVEPKQVYGNHALGMAHARMGNKTAAMQQYYILQNIDARIAADRLLAISPLMFI